MRIKVYPNTYSEENMREALMLADQATDQGCCDADVSLPIKRARFLKMGSRSAERFYAEILFTYRKKTADDLALTWKSMMQERKEERKRMEE